MNNSYFAPINVGGLQRFTQTGEAAGWYRLNLPGSTAPPALLPGITVPPGATGAYLEATAALRIGFSPSAAAGGTTSYLAMAAGSKWFLPGREWIANLCVLLTGSGTDFTIQFVQGSIGPQPLITQPAGSGGIIPPPPPGLSAIPTINVCHVMKNSGGQGGNDATGTRNRLDLPFLTIAAAEAAAQPGDTIVIWPGTYAEGKLGTLAGTYLLLGATISPPSGQAAFSISGIQTDIQGSGLIKGSDSDAVVIDSFGIVRIAVPIICAGAAGLVVDNGLVEMVADVNGYTVGARCTSGTLRIVGNVSSSGTGVQTNAASESAAIIDITGNVQGETVGILTNSGTVRVNGNVSATDQGINASKGRVIVRGHVSSTTTTAAGAVNGFIEIHGNVNNVDSYGVYVTGTGGVDVWGNVTSEGDYGAAANSGLVRIYGDVTLTATGNGNAAVTNGGTMEIYGRVRNLGTGTCAFCQDGIMTIYGDCIATSTGDGARCELGAMKVYGDCESTDGRGAFLSNGGTLYCEGVARSSNQQAAECNRGLLTLGRGAVTTGAFPAVYFGAGGGQVDLEGNAYLSNQGGNIIDEAGGGGDVYSRGAYANNISVGGGVNLVGTLNLI